MSYSHKANVDTATAGAPVTVPAGKWVHSWAAHSTAGSGTVTITPAGGSAQDAIPVPAGVGIGFTWPDAPTNRPERLGEGSTLAFVGTDTYLVVFS